MPGNIRSKEIAEAIEAAKDMIALAVVSDHPESYTVNGLILDFLYFHTVQARTENCLAKNAAQRRRREARYRAYQITPL